MSALRPGPCGNARGHCRSERHGPIRCMTQPLIATCSPRCVRDPGSPQAPSASIPRWVDPQSRRLSIARLSAAVMEPAPTSAEDATALGSGQLGLIGRRSLLIVAGAVLQPLMQPSSPALAGTAALELPAEPSTPSVPGGERYVNSKQGYALALPAGWERKDQAGADALWEDPGHGSASVSVTINSMEAPSIRTFGGLEMVGIRVLNSAWQQESTLGVQLTKQCIRTSPGGTGALLYCYEYELNSTRGLKRILLSMTVNASRLYILNAQYKCEKVREQGGVSSGVCDAESGPATLALLREVADSFQVLPLAM
mmetsp:Transcript_30453/g.77713  ORF Transcript_30453/g.77713 Transcript_30453/m.77713 type:complete len:312 (-) Transcript_30453:203-1138(-)